MNVSLQNIDKVNALLIVKMGKADYQEKVDKALKDYDYFLLTVTFSNGEETEISTAGRHDVCLCPRIVPVVEAMAALVTADLLLRNRAARI